MAIHRCILILAQYKITKGDKNETIETMFQLHFTSQSFLNNVGKNDCSSRDVHFFSAQCFSLNNMKQYPNQFFLCCLS